MELKKTTPCCPKSAWAEPGKTSLDGGVGRAPGQEFVHVPDGT